MIFFFYHHFPGVKGMYQNFSMENCFIFLRQTEDIVLASKFSVVYRHARSKMSKWQSMGRAFFCALWGYYENVIYFTKINIVSQKKRLSFSLILQRKEIIIPPTDCVVNSKISWSMLHNLQKKTPKRVTLDSLLLELWIQPWPLGPLNIPAL